MKYQERLRVMYSSITDTNADLLEIKEDWSVMRITSENPLTEKELYYLSMDVLVSGRRDNVSIIIVNNKELYGREVNLHGEYTNSVVQKDADLGVNSVIIPKIALVNIIENSIQINGEGKVYPEETLTDYLVKSKLWSGCILYIGEPLQYEHPLTENRDEVLDYLVNLPCKGCNIYELNTNFDGEFEVVADSPVAKEFYKYKLLRHFSFNKNVMKIIYRNVNDKSSKTYNHKAIKTAEHTYQWYQEQLQSSLAKRGLHDTALKVLTDANKVQAITKDGYGIGVITADFMWDIEEIFDLELDTLETAKEDYEWREPLWELKV